MYIAVLIWIELLVCSQCVTNSSETLHHNHHQAEPNGVPNICTRILMEGVFMEYSANDIATAWELHYLAVRRFLNTRTR
ncbi:hypothetical protein EDB19DRAFT_1715844 [Suillus lakei]|nr:hypothetical protein EDB19DRAFT_1715844 [Suillus lakei]